MFEKLNGHILVHRIIKRQFHGDPHHVECEHGHPAGTVGLFKMIPILKLHIAVEGAYVIQPQEPSAENIVSIFVFPVHPPGEIKEQFLKNTFQKRDVRFSIDLFINLIDPEGGPGMHGWVYIAEIPFVGGKLSIRVDIPFFGKKPKLVLCKCGIYKRKRNTVECEVPGSKPGILPFVRHGNNVLVLHMFPVAVSHVIVKIPWCLKFRISVQPFGDVVVIELFIPEKPCKGLSLHIFFVLICYFTLHFGIKPIRFLFPEFKYFIKIKEGIFHFVWTKAEIKGLTFSSFQLGVDEKTRFGPKFLRIYGIYIIMDQIVIDAVFKKFSLGTGAVNFFGVCFVVAEEGFRIASPGIEPFWAYRIVFNLDNSVYR